jgi:hypothetical protein
MLIVDQRWHASANREKIEPTQKTKPADAISTGNGLSYSVRIEAKFGSQFQRTVAIRNLNKLLAAWKALVEAQHKKNAITVTRSRESAATTPSRASGQKAG